MADSEVLKRLKDVPFRIQTASLKERKVVVNEIQNVLASEGITEPVVRFICRLLATTLHRYRDSTSQSYIKGLIAYLAVNHKEWTLKNFPPVLLELSEQLNNCWASKNTCQTSLYALRWSTVLIESALKTPLENVDCSSLVLAQANLLAAVTAFGDKNKNEKAYSMLHRAWSVPGVDAAAWMAVLLRRPPAAAAAVALAALARRLPAVAALRQDEILSVFTASLISVKVRPLAAHVAACAPLLALPGAAAALLPALHKALLRSPETSLEAVGVALALLDPAATPHPLFLEMGKSFIGNLASADGWVRGAARLALSALAARAPGPLARALLDHVFAVYAGLVSSEDKIAVLQGVTALLAAGAGERAALAAAAGAALARVLEAETHERTLCAAADVLAAWARALDAPLHPAVLLQLEKQLGAARTGPAVRLAYLRLLAAAAPPPPPAPAPAAPALLAAVERARAQPLQVGAALEGVCALAALARALAAAGAAPAQWAALLLPQRLALLHRRVLAAAADDVLEQVVLLCRNVLDNYEVVANDNQSPLYRAFILTLLSPARPVRSAAIENVKQLLARPDRAQMARNFVATLNEVLEEGKLFNNKEKSPSEEKNSEVTGKMILECIQGICAYREYAEEDRQSIAIEALPCCHHPLVARRCGRAWRRLLAHLRLRPRRLLALHADAAERHVAGYTPGEMQCGIAASLLACHPALVAPLALRRVLDDLRDPALLAVTCDEYFTYLTPENELYDKSVLPGNDESREQNLRRESRAYSYREQLDELQLRRELREEALRRGCPTQAPLTAKQKEAAKMQMAKESVIRQRLTELAGRVERAAGLLEALRRGAPDALRAAGGAPLAALLAALRCPLAAARALALYRALRLQLLPRPPALADAVARITIRLHEPQCALPAGWEQEPLSAAAPRVVELLHATATATATADHRFTAAGFCYIFPLLKSVLTAADTDEQTLLRGVQLLALHAAPAASAASAAGRLPLEDMLRLLLQLVGERGGRVQSASTAALLDVAALVTAGDDAGAPSPSPSASDDDADADAATPEDEVGAAAAAAEVQCLLEGLLSESQVVRDAALRALLSCRRALAVLLTRAPPSLAARLTQRLYVARFDVNEDNRGLGESLWAALPALEALAGDAALPGALLGDTQRAAEPLQRAAAAALAARAPAPADALLLDVQALYRERLPLIPAVLDQYGHELAPAADAWSARRGAALALHALAGSLSAAAAPAAARFFVAEGLADRAAPVRAEMLNAAMAVVELHGKETIGSQLPVFEEFLDKAPKSGVYDGVRESVVLLVGSLARHLAPGDARVRPIALRLVAALSTPSQQVQEAVSNCLPPLVASPALQDEVPAIVAKLMKQLLTAEKYGDRKGAAYGLAGVVKGLGILALKQLDIMSKLTEAIQEKKNYKYREGALFAFEMLCLKLGRLFEPYVVHVLPHLLLCFGDSSQYVRAAADDAARLIMSKLSAHGVKLVLPALLHALEDDNWRTKTGSVELLGAMAYCAPKQLSSCLPSIVPKLIEVLSDSHTRVQAAGGDALRVIGSVIRNPEIQAIVPVLLSAVQDPSHKTSACLQTLLDTKFVHFIDAPSLALIMPVVERAFVDRSTDTRKMAAQIIGNMYSLTDQKDLLPYLPHIMPGLKASLLDPVPEVRSVSARALGAMVKGMGEASFEELLPWLMLTLTSETSSVDRSGAAQGLSEVVAGLGVHQLHKLMPEIIATAERADIQPHVKDGYIMMFIYMPGAFTDEFLPYIGHIISPILQALADENEFVRETALKAGQRIVTLYADSAIALLLPELEKGLFDDNWRIRHASVQLLGDLLYRISGVSGKMSTETASEDDNFGTEQSHGAILRALGAERRDRVLAGLYMGRSDVALMVRQAALHVWKVVVTNTPKTLREILPTLFGLLLGCLASTSYDKRQVAARTLGDLVRKLGERVLPEIVPILERGLRSERADQRQGVCIGLGEIIASTSRDSVLTFADGLVPTVRTALCDPLPEVRVAAARTFDSLHATIGSKALDDILPRMLAGLRDPDPAVAEATLDGLRQVMAIKSRAVLPYLVPQLTAGPVDTRALSALAAAAGDALARHLHRVLPALLTALAAARDSPHEARELEHCRDALLPVTEDAGVRSILDALLEAARAPAAPDAPRRRAAAALLCAFVAHTRADLAAHVPALLRGLLLLLAWDERDVLQAAWDALAAVTRSLDAERQIQHVSDVRQAVRFAASDLKGDLLPGFCLPKGIAPLLPLFRESILNGLPEDKENAALMLGELIRLTSPAALQPSVVHITGPLIRILGDRFNSNVKAAVLETLALLLAKVGVMLKQFLPQLQTTFLKALSDGSRPVRMRAGAALAQLVLIHSRADPLFLELHAGLRAADDPAVRETMLQALRNILTVGGERMSPALALSVLTTLTSPALLCAGEEAARGAAGGCLGALLHALPEPHRAAALAHHVLAAPPAAAAAADDDWLLQHARSAALFVALKETPQHVYADSAEEKIDRALLGYLASDRIPIVCNGIRGIGYLIRYLLQNERPIPQNIVSQFMRSMNHNSNEVKQLMARACTLLGREGALCAPGTPAPPAPAPAPAGARADLLRAMLPALVNGTKEKNSYVRANAELALRAVLRLPADDGFQQHCGALLEEGAREALGDVVARVLRRGGGGAGGAGGGAPDLRDEDLDCTLLT